jgi:Mn-dependent DtxR family transcriptional regulator
MRHYLYKDRIEQILNMAKNETLPPSVGAAKKMKCSPRSIKNYIAILRKAGYPIYYDRKKRRYAVRAEIEDR